MASKAPNSGAGTPIKPPAESETTDDHEEANNRIDNVFKKSKPRTAALPSNQAPVSREAPETNKKPAKTAGHKRNNSDDSTLSMLVSPSDQEDNPSRERAPNPNPRRLRDGTDDIACVGSVFQAGTPSPNEK